MNQIIETLRTELEQEIRGVPDGFYDSFEYTKTGNATTHGRTLGYIAKIVWSLKPVRYVDIDTRLNGTKMKPDIVAYDNEGKIVLIIDYESPNSSDNRISGKAVMPYVKANLQVPYIIITTLPRKNVSDWELRWTSEGQVNDEHVGHRDEIRKNPFEYWYNIYKKTCPSNGNIFFMNINGKRVEISEI